jgi:hypothetical protein
MGASARTDKIMNVTKGMYVGLVGRALGTQAVA